MKVKKKLKKEVNSSVEKVTDVKVVQKIEERRGKNERRPRTKQFQQLIGLGEVISSVDGVIQASKIANVFLGEVIRFGDEFSDAYGKF